MSSPELRRPFAPFLGVLVVALVFAVFALFTTLVVWLSVYYGEGIPTHTAVAIGAVGAVLLGTDVWWARRWATRDRSRQTTAMDAGPAVAPGRIWLVPEPGVGLLDSPWGGGIAARLDPGTQVTELNRYGGCLEVAAADGSTGWVDTRMLTPCGFEPHAGSEPSEP